MSTAQRSPSLVHESEELEHTDPRRVAKRVRRLWANEKYQGKIAYSTPLDDIRDKIIDLTPNFTPERYRFVDADAFIHERQLTIYESLSLPTHNSMSHTAISYVWYGLVEEPSKLEKDGSFRVSCGSNTDGTPREDGGPISLKILEYICQYTIKTSSVLVWLDRLCILQTSKQDKSWQISQMYDTYESSEQCIVLPGGLQRLASVSEETSWIDRAWTYQEALATWDYAIVFTKDKYSPDGSPARWVVEGECYRYHLLDLFVEASGLLSHPERQFRVLGRNAAALDLLGTIIEYKTLNEVAPEEERINRDVIDQLVMQGVAVRTALRPVDMVFSILGLLGIQRILSRGFGEKERFRATLALAEAVFLPADDEDESLVPSRYLDVPLWESIQITNSDGAGVNLSPVKLPTLQELSRLLDYEATEVQLSSHPGSVMRRKPLPDWTFAYNPSVDNVVDRTVAIAHDIPDSDFIRAYSEVQRDRVLVYHQEEGWIELCRRLEDTRYVGNDIVLGWSLKLDGHPYIRFFKFVIPHILHVQK
ncbi:hypothetical protein VNI00_014093 [Paramarasmius palmivorus]|uniref:Heterokaryon incompatibility domain-containing protein n=1 Tax=Paramarasmius palmivorus TaxID=297713 RepID=A0AAW0BWI7_9AGAR